jgi:hypothetical protein
MASNYDLLIAKINEFTQKFYLNKLLRGSIYASAVILGLYLFLFVLIYYANPAVGIKTFLFFSFLIISLACIGLWVIKPTLAYFKLSKNMSLEHASHLIGAHFFDVKDRLLNTLQLQALADRSPQNNQLMLAGIDQKISELRPIPFAKAINLNDNRKHVKYILLPLGLILCIGIIAPAILKDGTNSLIRYNEEILPKAPFTFELLNKSLVITQGDDLNLKLQLKGNEFPQDVYLEDGINTYKLTKENISQFSYTFKNVQQSKTLRFTGGGFKSSSFLIDVKLRPALVNMSAKLIYPAYLNRKTDVLNNVGDLLVPEGTKVNWELHTENSEQLSFILQNKSYNLSIKDNLALFDATVKKSGTYQVVPKNNFVSNSDYLSHQINIIADQYPNIEVTESPDSISNKALYFSGNITDDYGFSSLKFKYNIKQDGKIVGSQNKVIPIKNNQTENSFFYLWNLNTIDLKPGQVLEYFFEVADNDGVNGAKTAKSEIKNYQAPTQQQIAEKIAEGGDALKKKMESAIKMAQKIEKDSKKLTQDLLDKKQLTFEDKKQIEQLLANQKELEESVKEIKAQNEKNNFNKQENTSLTEELKEKQKQIDDLFNNVLNEKTRELLQKLEKLMELNNKDLTKEELSKMQMDNKSLKNELNRILELYKQLEFEQSLQNKVDRLEDLAKQQKNLSEQAKSKDSSTESLKNKQEELNNDFKSLEQELKELAEKNQELEKPNDFKNPEKETKEIEQNQKDSKENLNKNDKQKAAQKQEKAAEQMKQLAERLQENQQQGEEEDAKTNAAELRKILENLLSTSFAQEKVMLSLRKMSINDPSYIANVQQQNTIKDNMKTVADSLFSLSKRVPQIQSTVNTEVEKINFNIGKSIDFLGDRRTAEANRTQQFAMTSINNLALMLNEALEQLQKPKGQGGGKGKKQSLKDLQKMQEQLNQKMQNAREKMQKEGNMGTVPKGQMSQEFAKMAQQQQMIREALQKVNKEENKDGKGSLGNLNQLAEDMKKTEMDLVNKKIAEETMNRQKNLNVKLLDAEKAQRQQDEDSKRESNAGKEYPPSYQKMLEQFKKQQQSESELIQKLPTNLNYYYKNKIAEYFKLLNSANK